MWNRCLLILVALLTSLPVLAQEDASPNPTEMDSQGPGTDAVPDETPPPPDTSVDSQGQWTYTSQYGWVWIPYAQQYTSVSQDGGVAYEYCYDESGSWAWLESPWVLGYGPVPYWGAFGVGRFAWYSRPWYTVGAYRGGLGYRGSGHGFRGHTGGGGGGGGSYHAAAPVTTAPSTTPQLHRSSGSSFHGGASFHGGSGHSGGRH